jgi:hypothetical protein
LLIKIGIFGQQTLPEREVIGLGQRNSTNTHTYILI